MGREKGGRVVVVGGLHVEHLLRVRHLPRPGETVSVDRYAARPAGKGFLQAVAAARQGAAVVMVGCVGDDDGGDRLIRALHDEGVDTGHVRRHAKRPTARTHIAVAANGERTTTVVAGANRSVTFPSAALEEGGVVLVQLEVPEPAVTSALAAARRAGLTTVLNASPAASASPDVYRCCDIVVANEAETGMIDRQHVSGLFIETRGERGAVLWRRDRKPMRLAPVVVTEVDGSAAGDAFCGALAAALAKGLPFDRCLRRAGAAGALAATVAGSLASLPSAANVDALVG